MTAGRSYAQAAFITKFKDRLKDLGKPVHLPPLKAEVEEKAISGVEPIKPFSPEKDLTLTDVAKAVAHSTKRHTELQRNEGYCFGFFALVAMHNLKHEDPKDMFTVVRTYIDCDPKMLSTLDEMLKKLLIPLEWSQFAAYHTEQLPQDERINQVDIEKIFKKMGINITEKFLVEDYNKKSLSAILHNLSENETLGIGNTQTQPDDEKTAAPSDDEKTPAPSDEKAKAKKFPQHTISVYRRGSTIYVHDPNYLTFESKAFSINRPDLILSELKACLYDRLSVANISDKKFRLNIRIIQPDVKGYINKIKSAEIKLDLKDPTHMEMLDHAYKQLPNDQFIIFIKEILENQLIKNADDQRILLTKHWGKYTLLHLAAMYNDFESFSLYINKGANIEAHDKHGRSVFTQVLGTRNEEMINLLLDIKPDLLRQSDHFYPTGFHAAIDKVLFDLVLKHFNKSDNALISKQDSNGNNLLLLAAKNQFSKFIYAHLENNKDLINVRNNDHKTLLDYAALNEDWDLFKYLVQHNAKFGSSQYSMEQFIEEEDDDEEEEESSKTPLHLAAEAKEWEVVKFMASYNANVNFKDADGFNALDYLFKSCKETSDYHHFLNFIKELADLPGLSLRPMQRQIFENEWAGKTILHLACEYAKDKNDIERIIMFVIEDIHAKKHLFQKDEGGKTPLDYAKKSLSPELFEDLTKRLHKGGYLVVETSPALGSATHSLFGPQDVIPSPQPSQTNRPWKS
ncbi:MAG: ankyrin repeat domain-containing protein [Gammaproteobacteria bacterium]